MQESDFIVIGSGFGGSIMACRLVEKGYRVCLLERGQEYKMHQFPRRIGNVKEKLFWDPRTHRYGYMEFRDDPNSDAMTLTASGLGGGSLIYANVLYKMPEQNFKGWPSGITYNSLNPYYEKVLDTMEANPYPMSLGSDLPGDPDYAETLKTLALRKAAVALGNLKSSETLPLLDSPQWKLPHLAVRFQGDFPGQQSKNKHGALQSKCTRCGECDIGCNIHAKNTLDLNYLQRAKNIGGDRFVILTESEAFGIRPLSGGGGYEVSYRNPKSPQKIHNLRTKKVVLAAGALHSPGILLRMKKKGHLPGLSPVLGKKWCGNGDLLGIAVGCQDSIEATLGPVITSAIEFKTQPYSDGFPSGFYIEDAGYPIGLSWYLAGKIPSPRNWGDMFRLGWRFIKSYLGRLWGVKEGGRSNLGSIMSDIIDQDSFSHRNLMLLGMGRDRSDGEVVLSSDHEPIIRWKSDSSAPHFNAVTEAMKKISEALGGKFVENPLTDLKKIVAVHPLGGCAMGETPLEGVVNPHGEVFGYPGLYVVDGSILPTSTGPNPSLTIAAMAEKIADQFPACISTLSKEGRIQ